MNNCIKYLAALGLSASMAFAHETINKSGQLGFDKTYSAKSMEHGQLSISILNDVDVADKSVLGETVKGDPRIKNKDYIGLSSYIGMSFGLFEIVDVAVMLPVYYEKLTFECENGQCPFAGADDAAQAGYLGNVRASLKFRAPLPEDQIFDLALILGGDFPTTNLEKRGIWIREPDYVVGGDIENGTFAAGYAYGTKQSIFRTTLAVTMDLRKIDAAPLLFHLNGGYRTTLDNDGVGDFYTVAAGLELYPIPVVSLFGEFYKDFPSGKYTKEMDIAEATAGLVFHIGSHLDVQVGGHFAIGDKAVPVNGGMNHDGHFIRYVDANGTVPEYDANWIYAARTIPKAYGYGGITWSGFLIDPDRDGDGVADDVDKCPDQAGDRKNDGCPWAAPDLDEDGICDPWVAEKGLLDQFADICEGIDQCPNEAGEGEDGCPLDDPDPDQDGVCDAWVSQKKMLKKYADVCSGIDNCPGQQGPESNMGCPEDNPDADGDGICDPWVSQKNRLADFSGVCQGYDQCPGQAGPEANQGCPWPDPDSDGDGVCDGWVTAKKMGYFFENADGSDPYITKKCKGLDKCEYEYGPAFNDGCPMGDPDQDKDGVCDAWVSEKGLLGEYEGICQGVDKCPTQPGSLENEGCEAENPDADGDGVCDAWVTQKGMLEKYADVCTGLDKCPFDGGVVDERGCPMDDPDPDHDGVCDAWVTKKGLLEKFANVCTGIDRCPLDSGSVANSGCKEAEIKPIRLNGVSFPSGKAVLDKNAKNALKGPIAQLKDPEYLNVEFVVQGHTDSQGKPAKNKKLSEDRAKAVADWFVKQGIDKSRIKAVVGCGADAPVADNKTRDGREENRRIEIKPVADGDVAAASACVAEFEE